MSKNGSGDCCPPSLQLSIPPLALAAEKKGGERRERESFGMVWPLCVKFHHSYALRGAAVSTGRRGLSQVIALSGRAAVSAAANSATSRSAHFGNSGWVAEDKK